LLAVEDLKTYFTTDHGVVKAVDGVSFQVKRRKTLGIVGESGSGKSVTARSILQIVEPPGRIVNGAITFKRPTTAAEQPDDSIDLASQNPRGRAMRDVRGKEISMIFQEPMASFSVHYTVGNQIAEMMLLHLNLSKREVRERTIELLGRVGLPQPERRVDAYPHQLSGGMLQRAMIAMAISCDPSLLIADEPTTALDVTTQAQILDLLASMQDELGMATMLITHDLGVIAELADDVVVMYLGTVAELGDVDSIFHDPLHPYTRALLQSIPQVEDKARRRLQTIRGSVPDPYNRPVGCPFHPRCPAFMPGLCDRKEPVPFEVAPGRVVSCHLYYGEGKDRAAHERAER
jgi:peptide/nickel transport system ATP-binding protein